MVSIKVLQIGFPKSGNSLLYSVLVKCLKKLGMYQSFVLKSGVYYIYKSLYEKYDLQEIFEGALEIDQLEMDENGRIQLAKMFPEKLLERIDIDFEFLLSATSIVWSHTKVSQWDPFMFSFGLRLYILRDGRDVINSRIHYTTKKHIQKFRTAYKISDPRKVYEIFLENNGETFAKYVSQWKEHVEDYFDYREHFVEVRYESLKNFGKDFIKILKIFGLENYKEEFIEEFSFKNMKKRSPLHLRKGKVGDWKNFFTEKHKEIFKEIAGKTLIELGYEKNLDW